MRRLALLAVVACASSAPTAVPPSALRLLPQLEAARDLDGVVVGSGTERATVAILFATWCGACHDEVAIVAKLRARHPGLRVLAVDYVAFEEFANRGNLEALRAFAAATPWLRVVPADDALFTALGRPPKIPTVYVFDRAGALRAKMQPRQRNGNDLDRLLSTIGA